MKKLICFALVCVIAVGMLGCTASTSKSYTFSLDNGDKIKVKLDVMGKYDLSYNVPFEISQNGVVQTQGTFASEEAFDYYSEAAESDENADILDTGTKDGNKYVFWSYNGSEFNYVILIDGTDSVVVLGNQISEESARTCFEKLTLTGE